MINKRVLTSAVAVPILYVIVWVLPPAFFVWLVMVAAVLGQHELYRMAEARGIKPLSVLGMLLGGLLILSLQGMDGVYFITLSLLLIMLARLFSRRPVEGAVEDIAVTFLGIFYVALLFGFQALIRLGMDGKQWLVFMYLVIWASDIGAYYVGTAWGRHRLYEKISPKKSIEGLIGGTLAAVAAGLLCRIWFFPSLGMTEAAMLGLALALAGTLGDLTESLIKRSAGVKDSGTLIPGQGGILDRMDSMLFAAPVLYYYITR